MAALPWLVASGEGDRVGWEETTVTFTNLDTSNFFQDLSGADQPGLFAGQPSVGWYDRSLGTLPR